ncbi:hypothetical protein HMI54_000927 [Coelomomyces lativittatus]|nr:hypothetical protein HMI55_000079 [Coelomomyces lativittatus]KAJ1511276.1 hypothetical protein HMI54_000927 [Coelomomyces lativittatus]KAJ1513482.1 hypothetical protein HMI56_002379 [Coelomomyces lativittatus]
MDSILVLSILLLLTSFPALISVNAAGVQTSKPLRFLYGNNELEFGPLKVKTQFGQNIALCDSVEILLGYFASALDIQTSSGEISDDAFAKKLDITAKELIGLFQKLPVDPFVFQMFLTTENLNFIQKNHQSIKSYFISIKQYIIEILGSRTCTCDKVSCTFGVPKGTREITYTDDLILHVYNTIDEFPSSWNPNLFNNCGNSLKCLVDAIRNTRPNREIENSLGSGSNSQSNKPKKEMENSKDSNLNGDKEGSMAIRLFQKGPFLISFMVSTLFVYSYVFLL